MFYLVNNISWRNSNIWGGASDSARAPAKRYPGHTYSMIPWRPSCAHYVVSQIILVFWLVPRTYDLLENRHIDDVSIVNVFPVFVKMVERFENVDSNIFVIGWMKM